MKALIKSKLVLTLIVMILLAGAIAIPLAGKITHSHAQGTITISEFPIPTGSSQPNSITKGPDHNLWFTEASGNKIGKITPSGTITEYAVSTSNSNPLGIISGPDGNLWFTEYLVNQIGKITPSGTITEYAVPSSFGRPFGITLGPDGNLWFTLGNNYIGKITPSGTVTEYIVPTSNSYPFSITTGSDGNLWFTEYDANQIGKITPSGTVTEYAVPTSNSGPTGITSGPDGNIWFTEGNNNNIGKITPSGTITEYAITTVSSAPRGITTGPDGNLWFVEDFGNKIGTITTSGTITNEYSIPTSNSFPYNITTGPDSNLWFVEGGANQIGRVNLFSSPPTLVSIPNQVYAGYAVSGSQFPNPSQPTKVLYSDVKGSWQVPTATCSKGQNSDAAFWVGLGGVQDLEQIAVVIDCTKGKLTYFAAYEVLINNSGQVVCIGKGVIHIHLGDYKCVGGNQASGIIKPGDSIDAEVSYHGNGIYLLHMHDSTQNWDFASIAPGSADDQAHNAADWIVEAPSSSSGQVQLLTKFSTPVHFQNCMADDNQISSGPTINKFLMTVDGNATGTPKATPTDLDSNGTGFTVTWESQG